MSAAHPPHIHPLLKAALCSALAAVALLGALAQPARAVSAGTPCWKVLLNDWYDGRIDGSYPRHCYNDALKHLPADVSTYSSAHDDIQRALQAAIAKDQKSGKQVGPNTLIVPVATSTGGGTGTDTTSGTGTGTTTTTSAPGRTQPGGLSGLADKLNPGSPSSLPVPLLILGALALILVAAGGVGLVAKRIQARRQTP